jgi:hypothetical protein
MDKYRAGCGWAAKAAKLLLPSPCVTGSEPWPGAVQASTRTMTRGPLPSSGLAEGGGDRDGAQED